MAKIDLKKSAGLSLLLEDQELIAQDAQFASKADYTIKMVKNQLLNKDLTYPEVVYTKYIGLDSEKLFEKKKLQINEYVIPANLMGIEYVKTNAVLCQEYPKLLEVHYGGGVVIMQKVEKNRVVDVIMSKIKRDQKLIVPAGYSMSIINTRQQPPLVVAEIYNKDAKTYAALDAVGGMSYYVIRKNAKQEIVRNPLYRSAPDMRKVNWDNLITKEKITLKTPLAKQIMRKYAKFKWLFKENSIEV